MGQNPFYFKLSVHSEHNNDCELVRCHLITKRVSEAFLLLKIHDQNKSSVCQY